MALYEPGKLRARDSVYEDFFWKNVDTDKDEIETRTGNSTTAPVHYWVRTPAEGHTAYWYRISVFLGPRAVMAMWDTPSR